MIRARWILRLYPKKWRDRYGRELAALLEDTANNPANHIDVLKGAALMRITFLARQSAWRTVLLFCAIGGLTGFVATQLMRTIYQSTATLTVNGGIDQIEPVLRDSLSRKRFTTMLDQFNLYGEDRKRMPLEEVVERMRRDVRVVRAGDGTALTVAFAHSDPRTAQVVTNELAGLITSNIARSQPQSIARTVDPANLPSAPISPSVRNVVSVGLLCGLLAGVVIAAWNARIRAPRHHSA